MCDICLQTPCLTQCPNAEDPTPVFWCSDCDDPIYPGEEYLETDEIICHNCVDDMLKGKFINRLGYELKEA